MKEFSNLETLFDRVLQRVNKTRFFSVGVSTFSGPDISLNVQSTIPSKALRLTSKLEPLPAADPLEPRLRKDGSWQAVLFAATAVLAYINWSWGGFIEVREAADDDNVGEDE
jgi:hypothetical protein